MSAYVSLGGQLATRARLTFPYYGTWVGDVELATSSPVPTPTTLAVGTLSLACAVTRQGTFAGTTYARVVGGFGGWRKPVTALSYYSPNGLQLSMLLGDAAGAVGEKISIVQNISVGNAWSREAAPASRALRQLAGAEWWVDPSGTTNVGSRPSTTVNSAFQVSSWRGGQGKFDVATEDLPSWLPGAVFSSNLVPQTTVGMTEITVDNKGTLRLSVLSAT